MVPIAAPPQCHTIDHSYCDLFESAPSVKSDGTHIITLTHNRPLILGLI